ncbi:MmcQ [Bacillus manliponensis]|uniref:MmcQ n=1 Tax=Bacillus manliponensis TaxID=574376 RepID=A0A073K8W8_9BACI|nr:MmcQ/YjbR family DNA-binding protein [Bacillus manliponensis]KEK18733.1 MmcQ [Bacillus manliponensis]
MEKHTLEAICQKQFGAIHDYKVEWRANRYLVGGKMFALFGRDGKGKAVLSLKCDPARAEALREFYCDIIPGYHLNKTHWNSIYLDADIPDELWEKLIVHSHELVLQKLSKKLQKEISNSL